MLNTDGEDAMKAMSEKTINERLQKDVDAVKNDVSALADQLSEILEAFKGDAGKQAKRAYKQARANVDQVVSDASKRGNEALGAAQDYANTIEETLEDAITQRPIAAVGLAIGLGFLIGVTWRR